ncbi:amidohydrolase [Sphingobium sp. LB126]|uniref:amidohydrolase family protein n=1 Tax=Sphingobium sp. LB126 TaxID=1983755 RepID=UPI000C2034C0|nr:amidohydrolase family protein [Sphingobium sp. LB126]PJG46415.1 amidohydrolase [Sphingobium sp. LB126]
MTLYAGPIFDCDTHLYEKPDAWRRYLPEKYKDWEFHFKTGEDGEHALFIGDRRVEATAGYVTEDGRVAPPGQLHEWLRAIKEGRENVDMRVHMTPDMVDRDARIAKMDEFGVEGCTLYMGWMNAGHAYLTEPESAYEVIHAYNRYLDEDWGFAYKNRIFTAPLLTLMDLDRAVQEAKWVVKQGARLVVMPMGPVHGKPPAHPDHDPFWSVLNEAGVHVAYHVGEATHMHAHMREWGEKPLEQRMRQSPWTWMHAYSERPLIETLSSAIFLNFFERFPNIKLISAENGCEWVPDMLIKMDKVRGIAKNGYWMCGQLKERPSRIFKRHVRVVAYPEDNLQSVVERVGSAECLLMGSDYPHAEGVSTPRKFADEACEGLTDEQTRAIMYDNGKELFATA